MSQQREYFGATIWVIVLAVLLFLLSTCAYPFRDCYCAGKDVPCDRKTGDPICPPSPPLGHPK